MRFSPHWLDVEYPIELTSERALPNEARDSLRALLLLTLFALTFAAAMARMNLSMFFGRLFSTVVIASSIPDGHCVARRMGQKPPVLVRRLSRRWRFPSDLHAGLIAG